MLFRLIVATAAVCSFLAVPGASIAQNRAEAFSRNLTLQIDRDVQAIVSEVLTKNYKLPAPSEVKLTIHPELLELMEPAEDTSLPAQSRIKLHSVRVLSQIVGDYPPDIVDRLEAAVLAHYGKNGYRVRASDDHNMPLFTFQIALTPPLDVKMKKWLVAASLIGAWSGLMLLLLGLGHVTFLRIGITTAPSTAKTNNQPSTTPSHSSIGLGKIPNLAPIEPSIAAAPDISPATEIARFGSIKDGPRFEEQDNRGIEKQTNPNAPKDEIAIDESAMRRVFQAKSFEAVIAELRTMDTASQQRAMDIMKLTHALRKKLTAILQQ